MRRCRKAQQVCGNSSTCWEFDKQNCAAAIREKIDGGSRVLVVGFVGCFVSGIAVHGKSSSYKQEADGLEKQFEPFLKACHKADVPGQKEAFKLFPYGKGWFGQYFEPEVEQQLAWDAGPKRKDRDGRLRG